MDGKLPTSLDGVSVNVGSKPAYVYFISPTQINVQAPDVGTGPVPVTVTTPERHQRRRHGHCGDAGSGILPVARQSGGGHAPGCQPGGEGRHLRRSDYGRGQARRRADSVGHRFRPDHPAGRRRHTGTRGQDLQHKPGHREDLGTTDAQVFGAALSPGFAGLYQVAIQVPASMADGDYPIKATVSGTTSPDGVILSVKK